MSSLNNTANVSIVSTSDDLPPPVSGLPRAMPAPAGTLPNVSDSGRIKFGAGFRLPTSK